MSNQSAEGDFRIKGGVTEIFYQGKWKSCDLPTPYERGRADMLNEIAKWLEDCPIYDIITSTLIKASDQHSQAVDLPQANSDVCGEEGAMRAFKRTANENSELMRRLADS